jgi:hypothetical protein
MANESKPVSGRKPPPPQYRFLKGKSGNPKGRPKGSVSPRQIVQKVALKTIVISYRGRPVKQTILEHVLDALKREVARGLPSMMTEYARISTKLDPPPEDQRGGFLVTPEGLTQEEWIAQAEKRNARARDPSLPWEPDAPDAEAEAAAAAAAVVAQRKQKLVLVELEKARLGLPSPLGHAMLTYERKWGHSYNPVR